MIWIVDYPDNFAKLNISNVLFMNKKDNNIKELLKKHYYYLISRYTFYTHEFVGVPYNRGQIRYFLNHSCFPIKNIKDCFWPWSFNSYIEVSSDLSAEYREKILGGGRKRMIKFGLPRNDVLLKDNIEKEKLGIDKYDKIIIWMPTFKHHKNKKRIDYTEETTKDITILNDKNIERINSKLQKNNTLLLIKYHPGQDMSYVDNYNLSNIKSYTNTDLINNNIDLYKLLGKSDALITDFSSVYFDYLLVDKPIAFELTDKEKYEKGRGFLMENPMDYMPGNKIYTVEDFEQFIEDVYQGKDIYKKERKELKDKIHMYQDGKSTERILNYLKLIK